MNPSNPPSPLNPSNPRNPPSPSNPMRPPSPSYPSNSCPHPPNPSFKDRRVNCFQKISQVTVHVRY